ncbi:MAG: 4-hydroxy-tetrahydrodipicolinate reductase [Lentihominibacter sp.]|jgi:4-hydroxy-tetrahydrodipicolinate reductase
MVKVIITAPHGQMDSLIVQEAYKNKDIDIVGCVGPKGAEYIGRDAGLVCGLGHEIGTLVYDNLEEIIGKCDVVIDFSRVEYSMQVLDVCLRHGKALICGTTGFTEAQTAELFAAGDKIPMMKAANTSYVVNVMRRLLADAAAALGPRCTIEIIEMHSETKIDAPSGTALELAEDMISAALDKNKGDIAFHSIRAGNTPSTHRIIFGCMGEKMEISHDAYDWRCCALGACDAILFMGERAAAGEAGLYTMEDVIAN